MILTRMVSNAARRVVRFVHTTATKTRKVHHRYLPAITFSVSFILLGLGYAALSKLHYGAHGRWYWNWEVTFHPLIAYLAPPAWWHRHIGWELTYFQQINDAPFMGAFPLPELSQPKWANVTQDHGYWYHDKHPLAGQPPPEVEEIVSPVILKLQVFSSVHGWNKRNQRDTIRRNDPRLRLPPAYRHLVEMKFIMGHAYREDWTIDEEKERELEKEQQQYGDLVRLDLFHGENLREGKILDWIHAAGMGHDGGRDGWYLFKMDDDTVVNLPRFLDSLISLDPKQPIYLGTSLNRWPAFHFHFTGMLTGFSYGLYKTLAAGITQMTRGEIERSADDDVLTGELMFGLPSAPNCRPPHHSLKQPYRFNTSDGLPPHCDPHRPPPWGYLPPPPSEDPRTGLIRHDYIRRMGDPDVWLTRNPEICKHSWSLKWPEAYEKESIQQAKDGFWRPPEWLEQFAEPGLPRA